MLLAVVEARRPLTFRVLRSHAVLVVGIAFVLLETRTRGFPFALPAAIGTPLVMGWLLQHSIPGARALAFVGGASYAMYLWHKDLYISYGVVGFVIAAAGAALSWALIERPILSWAHRKARSLSRSGTRDTRPAST
jgi:peptidoglycan/LPS O-acetylase OafA/YrhL